MALRSRVHYEVGWSVWSYAMRSLQQIVAAGIKQESYQETYRKSPRGILRQAAYNKLHNFENKVGRWVAAGQLPNGTVFTEADGIAAIELAREKYEKEFARLPKNTD